MIPTLPVFARSLILGASLVAAATSASVAHAEPPASTDRAADLYRRATRLYAGKKLEEAEPLYRQAWEIRQSYDIASNFGALELDLGKPRRAAELLTHAVREFPLRGRADDRAGLERRLVEARKLVGALRLKVGVAGAEIFVDGRSVGRAPLAEEVFVDPGARVIEARFAGYVDARLPLVVAAGVRYGVSLPMAPPRAPKRSATPLIVGGVLGAAAAGAGAALIALAEGQRRAANGLHDSISGAGASCASSSAPCSDLHAAAAKADTLGNAGIGAFAIAGAAVLGTATYALWPALKPAARGLDVRAGLGLGGVVITGSF